MSNKRSYNEKEIVLEPDSTAKLLEGERGGQLRDIFVDVLRRDEKIDIIFYLAPGGNIDKAENSIQKSMIDIFGHDPGPLITLAAITPDMAIEVAGRPALGVSSFSVEILPPKSKMYNPTALKNLIMQRVGHHHGA